MAKSNRILHYSQNEMALQIQIYAGFQGQRQQFESSLASLMLISLFEQHCLR